MLSLQDNKIIIDKVLEILITLYSFKNVINSEFFVSIYKKITNINKGNKIENSLKEISLKSNVLLIFKFPKIIRLYRHKE